MIKKNVCFVIIILLTTLTVSSCNSTSPYLDDFNNLYNNIRNNPVNNSENYIVSQLSIEQIGNKNIACFIEKHNIAVLVDKEIGIYNMNNHCYTQVDTSDNGQDIINVTAVSNDYIIYIKHSSFNWTTYDLYCYDISQQTGQFIKRIENIDYPHEMVIINTSVYYDVGQWNEDKTIAYYDVYSIDLNTLQETLIASKASHPGIFHNKLAYVRDNKEVVTQDKGSVSVILDLKESGLYQKIANINISNELITYNYFVMHESLPDTASGGGTGFIEGNKRCDLIESDKSIYPQPLLVNKDFAIWNDYCDNKRPMFYDRIDKSFVILDEDEALYIVYLGDECIYFVTHIEESIKIIKVEK